MGPRCAGTPIVGTVCHARSLPRPHPAAIPQPAQPLVPVLVTARPSATLAHGRPPGCVGTPSPSPHQEDVLMSSPNLPGLTTRQGFGSRRRWPLQAANLLDPDT